MSALTELLFPYNTEDFLRETWTQKGLFIAGQGQRKFDRLFSWNRLNDLLNYHEFEYPAMRLAVDGEVLPPNANDAFVQHCQSGATLILDRIHKLVPEITQFCGQLRYEIGHPVQVNVYASAPGKQGFSRHYDTHEVFILQIEGCKEWQIYGETYKYPLVDQKSAGLTPPDAPPSLTCVLEPGDLLYIPRGHWHDAIAQGQPSLHLTLGVLCKTGIDYLEWLVEDLKQQEAWRRNLPTCPDTNSAEINQHIQDLVVSLQDYLKDQHQTDPRRYFASLEKPIASYAFPYQAGFQIFVQGVETQFQRPLYQHTQVVFSDEFAHQIRVGSKEISLKGIPQAFIEQWLSAETFTGKDVLGWLPDADWDTEIVPLLSRLVQEGVILVAPATVSNQ